MPYFDDLNTYLHQSSLLIQAYPSSRITTKYSLPRKPNTKARSSTKSKTLTTSGTESAAETTDATSTTTATATAPQQSKRERSATLTLKTFHPESGICLKYRTDKAAEVGRLLNGLGRLAKGEVIDVPTGTAATTAAVEADADKMDVDGGGAGSTVKVEEKVAMAPPVAVQGTQNTAGTGGGGGKSKKKKGKK